MKSLPLLVFVVLIYFVVVLVGPGLEQVLYAGVLPSGESWAVKVSDAIIALGLFVLFFELVKATRSTVASMIDQALSMLLFAGCIVLFLLVRSAASATFLLLTVMSFIDVLASFVIALSVSRRDVTIERGA